MAFLPTPIPGAPLSSSRPYIADKFGKYDWLTICSVRFRLVTRIALVLATLECGEDR